MVNSSRKKNRAVIILCAVVAVLIILNLAFSGFNHKRKARLVEAQTLRDLSELATVEYRIRKIVRVQDDSLFGSRRLLIEAPVIIRAGIDLSKIKTKDIVRQDKSITVYLPEPELLDLIVDMKNIREVVNETGILRSDFSPEEKNIYLRHGEQSVRDFIARGKIDIFKVSVANTRLLLSAWLKRLGYENVEIVFQKVGISKESAGKPAAQGSD